MMHLFKMCVRNIQQCDIWKGLPVLVLQNVPQVDAEGFCIRPEGNENDILHACIETVPTLRLHPAHHHHHHPHRGSVPVCFSVHNLPPEARPIQWEDDLSSVLSFYNVCVFALTVLLTCQREFLLFVQRLGGRRWTQEVPRRNQARSAKQRHAPEQSHHRRA